MKAEELMIGDFLRVADLETNIDSAIGLIGKVVKIEKEGNWQGVTIHLGRRIDDTYYCEREYELEPVPLTPEILEKNGWIKDGHEDHFGDSYNYNNSEIWGWIDEDGMDIGFQGENTCISVKYVHQLQHALRLCGINKEIEL